MLHIIIIIVQRFGTRLVAGGIDPAVAVALTVRVREALIEPELR